MIELMTALWACVAGWLIATTCLMASVHFIVAPIFFGADGAPKRCRGCGSNWKQWHETVRDSINGIVCESETFCTYCGDGVGYWAYGSWEPHTQFNFIASYERAAPWFGLLYGAFCGVAACWNL